MSSKFLIHCRDLPGRQGGEVILEHRVWKCLISAYVFLIPMDFTFLEQFKFTEN